MKKLTSLKKQIADISYVNPWSKEEPRAIYRRTGVKVYPSKCGQGAIVKVSDKWFDYLVNGRVVTQRAGKSFYILDDLIKAVKTRSKDDEFMRALSAYDKG